MLGRPRDVSLGLKRMEAHFAMNQLEAPQQLLGELWRLPDVEQFRAELLLWEGELALARWEDPDRALEPVAEATKGELSPANRAYAEGLLADSTSQALEHFRQALTLDPVHHRALSMLNYVLLLLGQTDELEQRLEFAKSLFPYDVNVRVVDALSQILQGSSTSVDTLLAAPDVPLSGTQRALVRRIAEFLGQMRDPELRSVLDPYQYIDRFLLKTRTEVEAFEQIINALSGQRSTTRLAVIPPAVSRDLKRIEKVVRFLTPADMPSGPEQKRLVNNAVAELDEISEEFPEGTVHYLHGLLLLMQAMHQGKGVNDTLMLRGRDAFLKAGTHNSLATVQQHALVGAVLAEGSFTSPDAPWTAERQASLSQIVAKLLFGPKLGEKEFEYLYKGAWQADDTKNLAWFVLARWQRDHPESQLVFDRRLVIERFWGASLLAIRTIDATLDAMPAPTDPSQPANAKKKRAVLQAERDRLLEEVRSFVEKRQHPPSPSS